MVYGWLPETIAKLTLPQFETYQAYAYEHLAKQEVTGGMFGVFGHQKKEESVGRLDVGNGSSFLDNLETAALRLKKRHFGDTTEKKTFPMNEVFEEMKNG